MALAPLPLPPEALPEGVRRFVAASTPAPARLMAARGALPLRPPDLVTLLVQLAHEPDPEVADTARASLLGMPPTILVTACGSALHASVLDWLADFAATRAEVLTELVGNAATDASTIARLALTADEPLTEIISTNQHRLLEAPAIIEALYRNPKTRMSTADRVVELAARHGLRLTGIPAFEDHAAALEGQLIPEPSDEPLPGDTLFQEALAADGTDPAVDIDPVDGAESVREAYLPLRHRVSNMTTSEKIRLSLVGNAAARAILVRDPNRVVAMAAIGSPMMTDVEAAGVACSREVSIDVLRFIGNRRQWLKNYELKRALVFNPKTPQATAMGFISHLREADLKDLTRSRNVPASVKRAAVQRLTLKKKDD